MEKKNYYAVLDRMHDAAMAANEQKKNMDAMRPEADRAVARLLRARRLSKNFTGELEHNGYTIRIQRRTIIQFMCE